MSYIGPLTQNLLEACSKELKKKETREKIMQNVFDPVANELFKKYSLYISCFMFIHLVIIILLIYIIYSIKK